MSSNNAKVQKSKIICVVGPTASGKSDLGLYLANIFDGEIINGDSRQFYREMNVGTAKPSPQEMAQIPHHLIDCASIENPWSVGTFVQNAEIAISDIESRGKVPIVVGGTGLYLKSLLYGIDQIPPIPEDVRRKLIDELNEKGLESLYQELQVCDLESANVLKQGDQQRILRALEVYRHTGQSIRSFWKTDRKNSHYNYLKLGLEWDRDVLYDRINRRVEIMIEQGLEKEVRGLVEDYPENTLLTKTIGYAEWIDADFDSIEQITNTIQKKTRNFAKRQLTWYRNEGSEIKWVRSDELDNVEGIVKTFLNS